MTLTKIINLRNLVPKVKGATIVMKIGTERKWNMLIINIVLGIDAIDPKL